MMKGRTAPRRLFVTITLSTLLPIVAACKQAPGYVPPDGGSDVGVRDLWSALEGGETSPADSAADLPGVDLGPGDLLLFDTASADLPLPDLPPPDLFAFDGPTGDQDLTTAVVKILCNGALRACGDGVDNDLDGKVDMDDPDCVTPCQYEEAAYISNPNDMFCNKIICREDCFFDPDCGVGNDGCRWDHDCDPLQVPPAYSPMGAKCAYSPKPECLLPQSPGCTAACLPLVPNGCDCFGCCTVPGLAASVQLNSTPNCNASTLTDPMKCRPCTQVASCVNPCSACELCIGRTTLPAGCTGPQTCPTGSQPCGLPGQASCPKDAVCVTGCCRTASFLAWL